jgi:hypothetical protein
MSALTDQRLLGMWNLKRTFRLPLAANAVIRKGASCGIKGGYLYQWNSVEGLTHPCIAILATRETVIDNTGGADGDLFADVDFGTEKLLYPFGNDTGSPITEAQIGGIAYGLDDQTVTASATGNSPIGTPWIVSAGGATDLRAGVYVEMPAGALAAFVLAQAAAQAALAAVAPGMQAVDATLVAGTITIAAGITVAANSEVIPLLIGAITGSTNFASLRELKASRVNGAPGVGSIVIEAVGADGAKDVDAAGAIRVVILTPQA